MSFRFHLHANDVASYRWGSLLATYSPFAPVDTRTLPETIASFAAGVAAWKSNPEFRENISFIHECVHYLQDMLTGVGHWDYTVRRKSMRGVLGDAMLLTWAPQSRPPFTNESARDEYMPTEILSEALETRESALDSFLFVPSPNLSASRMKDISGALAAAAGVKEVPQSDVEPLLVDSLLESEAMVTAWLQVSWLKMSDEQWEIAEQNRTLFNPLHMSSKYVDTFYNFYGSLSPAEGGETNTFVKLMLRLFPFFVDLSCAHPSERLLEQTSSSKMDYYPGLKFARLIRSFLKFTPAEDEKFYQAIYEKDVWKAEDYLLQHCEFPYMASRQIYEDWSELFTEMAKADDNRILRIRQQCSQFRLSDPSACVTKTLSFPVFNKVPIYYLLPTGIQSYGFSYDHIDPEEKAIYFADLMQYNRDLALIDYYFDTGQFICPFAEANVCDAITNACRTGITEPNQFPQRDACLVRHSLEAAGFKLD
ncbi:MAG TPA: hypothetical protein VJS44_01350 [Pyrinomonadaceae bacterium]|nr:hypothetical protein [Pyrinomonadaceae bacterium]